MEQVSTPAQTEAAPVVSAVSELPVTQVPVTWAHLNLTGKLIYLSSKTEGNELTSSIQMLDLATGEMATIFHASPAWVYYAAVSPDAKTLVISYASPKQSSSPSVRSLYVIRLDASDEPQPLFAPPTAADRYTQAEWSPDGKHIYYVHYNQEEHSGQFYEDYDISRMSYPEGAHEQILQHAFWPRLSADASRLVYVALDPDTGKNELFVANADGSEPQHVALSGVAPEIIDAPLFLPDGQTILFSAPEPSRSSQPAFLEKLLGIQVVRAHNVPSDWWSVPVEGGVPTRLTHLQTINLFASISPDRKHVASLSGDGIFIMEPDGSNLTQLIVDPGVHGTLCWIP